MITLVPCSIGFGTNNFHVDSLRQIIARMVYCVPTCAGQLVHISFAAWGITGTSAWWWTVSVAGSSIATNEYEADAALCTGLTDRWPAILTQLLSG
jgi:hypothetical protein